MLVTFYLNNVGLWLLTKHIRTGKGKETDEKPYLVLASVGTFAFTALEEKHADILSDRLLHLQKLTYLTRQTNFEGMHARVRALTGPLCSYSYKTKVVPQLAIGNKRCTAQLTGWEVFILCFAHCQDLVKYRLATTWKQICYNSTLQLQMDLISPSRSQSPTSELQLNPPIWGSTRLPVGIVKRMQCNDELPVPKPFLSLFIQRVDVYWN